MNTVPNKGFEQKVWTKQENNIYDKGCGLEFVTKLWIKVMNKCCKQMLKTNVVNKSFNQRCIQECKQRSWTKFSTKVVDPSCD